VTCLDPQTALLLQRGAEHLHDLPSPDRPLPELGTRREMVRQCLERPASLRPWELGFLRDLPNFPRLSVKQRYILKEIADRVLQQVGVR
jgi:hypothetical protein